MKTKNYSNNKTMTNREIAQEISSRIGNSPVPFDSVYSIALQIYNELGGEETEFDSVYSILLEILPLAAEVATVIDDTSVRADKTWSSSKINSELSNKQDTLVAGSNITIENNVISATGGGGGDISTLINSVTYDELKTLRDSSALAPGQKYRITDYVTTTALDGTKSANHQFDIIVTADDVNKLNENAKAINHNFSGQTVTYYKWMYDNTGDAWILSNEDSYTNEVSGTCPLEGTPMYGMEYYSTVYPIEGVIGVDDEVPYTPQVYRKAIIYNDGNTLYLGDYIDEDKWNYWVEEGEAFGDYPEWFIGKYFLDDADTYSYDGTYVEGEDYFNPNGEQLYIWLTHTNTDVQYKIFTEEQSYSNSVAGTCEIPGYWEGLEYYTVGYPIAGVEYVDGESGAYLNDEKVILYTDDDNLVFGDSPYNYLLERYQEETEAEVEHEYTPEQIEWFNGKYFIDEGDTEEFNTTYEGVIKPANAKLNAWEIKYCLDNDTTRFNWADDVNGKGVIYYMKDEFNNEAEYDFKNIILTKKDIIAVYWEYEVLYAIRYPEADGTNPSTDYYNNYFYAWKWLNFEGGNGASVTIPDVGCWSGYEVEYQPLTSIPDWSTEDDIIYFPIDSYCSQFEQFLYQGDDCESTVTVLDKESISGFLFGGAKDDSLRGGSNNNSVTSEIEDGVIKLPNMILNEGTTYYQNFIDAQQLEAGNNISIENGVISCTYQYNLPAANTNRLGGVKIGAGLNMPSDNKLTLKTASANEIGGIKVGSGLNINSNGVLSVPVATTDTLGGVKVGDGLTIVNGVLSVNSTSIDNLYFTTVKLIEDSISEYLTFEAINSCTISFRYNAQETIPLTIEVSTDKVNWTSKTSTQTGTELAVLNAGDKLYIRGDNPTYGRKIFSSFGSATAYHFFITSDNCYVYGNVMSLINSTNFKNITTFNGSFYRLFYNYWDVSTASNWYSKPDKLLMLSPIILDSPYDDNRGDVGTYERMFQNCENISKVAVLARYNLNTWHNYPFSQWLDAASTEGVIYTNDFINTSHLDLNIPSGWTTKELLGKDNIIADDASI